MSDEQRRREGERTPEREREKQGESLSAQGGVCHPPSGRTGRAALPLPPATVAKMTMPTPPGRRHYAMLEVAVAARKRGLGPDDVRACAARCGEVSGVPMGEPRQQRHLDGIVEWTLAHILPDPPPAGGYAQENPRL